MVGCIFSIYVTESKGCVNCYSFLEFITRWNNKEWKMPIKFKGEMSV